MVTIISKSDGPRREDIAARKVFEKDRATITRMADHLTQGAYSKSRQAAAQPQPDIVLPERQRLTPSDSPRPYVRISPNGRVLIVDLDSSRQLAFLGELRRQNGRTQFHLATEGNGFVVTPDDPTLDELSDLDGFEAPRKAQQEELKTLISQRMGLT